MIYKLIQTFSTNEKKKGHPKSQCINHWLSFYGQGVSKKENKFREVICAHKIYLVKQIYVGHFINSECASKGVLENNDKICQCFSINKVMSILVDSKRKTKCKSVKV